MMLIDAESALRATAVIPENEIILFSRVIRCAVVDESFQYSRIRHEFFGCLYWFIVTRDAISIEQHQLAGIRIILIVYFRVRPSRFPDLIVNIADLTFGIRLLIAICPVIKIIRNHCISRQVGTLRECQISVFVTRVIIIIQLPLMGSSGHDEECNIIVRAESGSQDLLQVIGRQSGICFQIGAAVVEQDRPFSLRIRTSHWRRLILLAGQVLLHSLLVFLHYLLCIRRIRGVSFYCKSRKREHSHCECHSKRCND